MRVIDSHTEGEPTRLVIEGGPDLGTGPLAERRRVFAERFDDVRRFALNEPRGFPAMVGALLCEPADESCDVGLIFFNNAGYLGMCGHGTIGAVVTLAHMGRLQPGTVRIDTPVGVVTAELHDRNRVTIANVPSYVHLRDVALTVPGIGSVTGDVAWGGNWFFLTEDAPVALTPAAIPVLTAAARAVKDALTAAGITGADGGEIDHIEFFGRAGRGRTAATSCSVRATNTTVRPAAPAPVPRSPASRPTVSSRWARPTYRRASSAAAFQARYEPGEDGRVRPRITGQAWVTAETTLVLDPADPFPRGIGA